MKKLLSTNYSDTAFNIAIFLMRATMGFFLCINHGIPKLANFASWQHTFYDPIHIGSRWSLVLSIFAEVFASMFLVLGLFSRLAAFVLVINMFVASFIYHQGHPLIEYEDASLFLVGFFVLLLVGPGRLSVDAMTGK